ncbi:N-glycosylase/DNA lyase [Candidatus Woesearchaeota archaeon]|nr:N-glycosylase/DNA lyase [Candidatus Woesearchaeota archaeon]
MGQLYKSIKQLKLNDVGKLIVSRLNEFSLLGKRNINETFKELCFCIMTANFQAEKSIFIQKEIGDGFLNLSEKKLAEKLKKLGHRFPNTRAKYICEARKFKDELTENLNKLNKHSKQYNEFKFREWLVENIKGIGYKEASHFLRNIGYTNIAIIDFHIIDVLAKYNLIEKPKSKSLPRKKYIEIEKVLRKIGEKADLNLAELDLYLWYMETGKVLK